MATSSKIRTSDLSFGLRLDPEYYQQKYLQLDYGLSALSEKLKNTVSELKTGKTPEYSEGKNTIPVIRSGDLHNVFVHEETNGLLRTQKSNKSIDFGKGDILISAIGKGSIGKVSLYVGDGTATTVSEVIVLVKSKINAYLLAAFLSSKYGQMQIERQITGSTGQLHLLRPYLENILIPLNLRISEEIERLYKKARELIKTSEELYPEAEKELLQRIGWEKVNMDHVLSYKKSSKEVFNNERCDPEFFQPKFENVIKHLKNIKSMSLGNFCEIPYRGVQPEYEDNGDVLVINSKHLGPTEIDIENAEKTSQSFIEQEPNKKSILKKFDVLMYSTGAYVGRTNCYLEDKKGIASNHVTIIRPDNKTCDPVYLALFLNSTPGLMQTDQRASGSAQREIYPQEIVEYQIFIPITKQGKPDLEFQKRLADRIIKANDAKKEAKQKLKEAKELVEKEIGKLIKK